MPKWVNTRVVLDIESGAVVEREGCWYSGCWALASNVTSTFLDSGVGHISNAWTLAASATDFSGTDFLGGGNGANLMAFQYLNVPAPPWLDWGAGYGRGRLTVYDTQSIIEPVPPGGQFGAGKLSDGTDLLLVFAPVDWLEYQTFGSVTPPQTLSATATDAISLGESVTRALNLTQSVSDSVALTESLTRTLAFSRAATDSVAPAESVARTVGLSRSLSESVAPAESVARAVALTRTATDSISFVDSVARSVVTGGGGSSAGFRGDYRADMTYTFW